MIFSSFYTLLLLLLLSSSSSSCSLYVRGRERKHFYEIDCAKFKRNFMFDVKTSRH